MLELDGLTRKYGTNIAMDNLTFTVNEGEVVGFMGPNGAGKTTAMRSVLGIVQPDSGQVRWRKKPVNHDARLQFGYMPEERGLYGTMLVLEHLVYLARLHGMSREAATKSASNWLDILGVMERAKDRIDSLSMGNQQRIQMAAALVHSPDVLILDEPFSGLDPTGIEALSQILSERAQNGAAVVFSSHQLDLVENLCQRVVIINKGRTVITGTTEELTTSGTTLVVRVEANENGEWAYGIEGAAVERVEHGTVRLTLDSPNRADVVLDAARKAGFVKHFSFEKRRLSEVFREAVRS